MHWMTYILYFGSNNFQWSEVKWSEVKRSEAKWTEGEDGGIWMRCLCFRHFVRFLAFNRLPEDTKCQEDPPTSCMWRTVSRTVNLKMRLITRSSTKRHQKLYWVSYHKLYLFIEYSFMATLFSIDWSASSSTTLRRFVLCCFTLTLRCFVLCYFALQVISERICCLHYGSKFHFQTNTILMTTFSSCLIMV